MGNCSTQGMGKSANYLEIYTTMFSATKRITANKRTESSGGKISQNCFYAIRMAQACPERIFRLVYKEGRPSFIRENAQSPHQKGGHNL